MKEGPRRHPDRENARRPACAAAPPRAGPLITFPDSGVGVAALEVVFALERDHLLSTRGALSDGAFLVLRECEGDRACWCCAPRPAYSSSRVLLQLPLIWRRVEKEARSGGAACVRRRPPVRRVAECLRRTDLGVLVGVGRARVGPARGSASATRTLAARTACTWSSISARGRRLLAPRKYAARSSKGRYLLGAARWFALDRAGAASPRPWRVRVGLFRQAPMNDSFMVRRRPQRVSSRVALACGGLDELRGVLRPHSRERMFSSTNTCARRFNDSPGRPRECRLHHRHLIGVELAAFDRREVLPPRWRVFTGRVP